VADVVDDADVGEGSGGHEIVGGGVLGFMSRRGGDKAAPGDEIGLGGLGRGHGNTFAGSTVGKFFKSKEASLPESSSSSSSL
jgi:hypothetical protein